MPVRDQDPTFVGEFLNDAMTIFSRVTSEQQAARQEQAFFSVLPKKVKNVSICMINQNSLLYKQDIFLLLLPQLTSWNPRK
jgi:hypothetical protein